MLTSNVPRQLRRPQSLFRHSALSQYLRNIFQKWLFLVFNASNEILFLYESFVGCILVSWSTWSYIFELSLIIQNLQFELMKSTFEFKSTFEQLRRFKLRLNLNAVFNWNQWWLWTNLKEWLLMKCNWMHKFNRISVGLWNWLIENGLNWRFRWTNLKWNWMKLPYDFDGYLLTRFVV